MTMKKYLQFLKYAFKEQWQYRTNFFASIATMIFNDACFMIIFIIFLWYFTETWLTFGNFLALCAMSCMWYWVIHWLFINIWNLPIIIEQGKLDYYLSFPLKPLSFLMFTKVWVTDLGDIIFGLICLWVYAFVFSDSPAWIVLLKWIALLILSATIALGVYIMVWSISFRLQKWSKVADLFNSIFVSFWQYPPEMYEQNKLVLIFMCLLLFPSMILPYRMMMWTSTLWQWLLLIWFAIIVPLLWILVVKKWLKRYSSGNLVHQM